MSLPVLTDALLNRLREEAVSAAPREAAGVLINESWVIALPNHAENPERFFELRKSDILDAVGDTEIDSLVIWHSHPNGGVGPSRQDMMYKVQGVAHLVVTLVDGEIVPTWY